MLGKTIGFYTGRLHNEDSLGNFEAVVKEGKDRGFNILSIYVSMGISGGTANDDEECYTSFVNGCDAVIIDGFKITNRTFISKIVRAAEKQGKPAILFNDIQEDCRCLYSVVEESFDELLCHLVNVHKCTKIDLMLGYLHRWNSDKLIDIYRTVLSKFGIEYDENRIVYGNYWIDGAQRAGDELLAIDTPDAIVCANDAMAIALCDLLKKRGLKVPDDVIVTGIDGSVRSDYYIPSLTTIDKNQHDMASLVFDQITSLLDGKDVVRMTPVKCPIKYGKSCGCKSDEGTDYSTILNRMYAQQEKRVSIEPRLFEMARKLPELSEINDISALITDNLPEESFICVRDSFLQDIYGAQFSMTHEDGKMYVLADTRREPKTWTYFDEKSIFPEYDQILAGDVPVIISPLFYDGMYFGNWVITDPDYSVAASIFDRFISHIESLFARYISDRRLRLANCELYHVSAQVKEMSDRDTLTGMLSANGFVEQVEELKKHCMVNKETMVLCCIDIDRLANINNIYGHFEGDHAIKVLGTIISDAVGDLGICAHIGGDEFVAALHVKLDAKLAADILFKELDNRITNYNSVSGKEYTIEINQNSTVVDFDKADDMRAVLDQAFAEKALIKEGRKRVGNTTAVVPDNDENSIVDDCINNNRFRYAYQPIVSAKDGSIYAYEALMRSATEKFISPLTILKHASDTGRLYEIEKSTFFNVLNQCYSIKDKLGSKRIFINSIPGYQLDDMDYDKLKVRYGDFFDKLVVEITEQTEMSDDEFGIIEYRSKQDGFAVAIDDYGTGYSNTAALLKYQPHVVKIDRLLIADIQEEPKKQHFVKNIIEFAHNNGFMALAEGVETIGELRAVIHMGVDLIQGFYTAKPDFNFLEEISQEVYHDIIQANMGEYTALHKKMFVVNGEKELPVMRLSLEQYTGIIVAQEFLNLVGNSDFVAGMTIKIKDDTDCHIVMKDVCIASEDDTPCIELGNNVNLTLELWGTKNELHQAGIRVPATSTVKLIGGGKLDIMAKNVECYGIGGGPKETCGSVIVDITGRLNIKCDGNKCIGIGAGTMAEGSSLRFVNGHTDFVMSCEECVAIGAINGSPEVIIDNCSISQELRVSQGVGVGAMDGRPIINMSSMRIDIHGSGTKLCGMGSLGELGGEVRLDGGKYVATLNGRELIMLGSSKGEFKLWGRHAGFKVVAEGNDALGIGSGDDRGIFDLEDAGLTIILRTGKDKFIGATRDNMRMIRTTEEYSKT